MPVSTSVRTMQRVAPREGAWIEIQYTFASVTISGVAPREGAWIEITR